MREGRDNRGGVDGIKTSPGADSTQMSADGGSRESLVRTLWRYRWVVLATAIAGLAGGFVYIAKATPIYSSASRVYIEQATPKIINENEHTGRSANYLNTQCELIKSSPILGIAVDGRGLKSLKTLAGVSNPVAFLKHGLTTQVGKTDDIINVALESPYPEDAAQIVNAVVDAYVTYQARQKRSTAAEVLRILQKEKAKRDAELTDKLKAIVEFKKINGLFASEREGGNVVLQRLVKLSDALTAAQVDAVESKADWTAAKAAGEEDPAKARHLIRGDSSKGGPSGPVQDSSLQGELRSAQESLAAQMASYGPQVPVVQLLEAKVGRLKAALAAEDREIAKAFVALKEQRYVAARERKKELAAAMKEQETLAQDSNLKSAQYAVLQSERDRLDKLCNILDNRIKELNVTEDAGVLNINILEVAKVAAKPVRPDKVRVMTLALVGGILLGIAIVLAREWTNQRIQTPDEASAVTSLPVLGVVPHMRGRLTRRERGLRTTLEPQSQEAEAYRTVRTAVYFGVPDGVAKTILICSPTPGDGKTTTVSNLAIAMAKACQRTLIIDADFRKPMQHEIFGISQGGGLSAVLAGRGVLEESIYHTDIEQLDVLPCGPIPLNPSEMLSSPAFAKTLEQLAEKYDHILLDSPPIIPVTDSRILGAMSGATLLVIKAGKSTRKATRQAREMLLSTGARLLGIVVNDLAQGRSKYGYYDYYGSYGASSRKNRDLDQRPLPVAEPTAGQRQ